MTSTLETTCQLQGAPLPGVTRLREHGAQVRVEQRHGVAHHLGNVGCALEWRRTAGTQEQERPTHQVLDRVQRFADHGADLAIAWAQAAALVCSAAVAPA